MKNLILILTLFIAFVSCNANDQNKLKPYDVKSGIVEYSTTTSGKMMGSTISGSGIEKLFFKDWGAVELKETESSQTTTIKIFGRGKTETESTHTINKLDNGESYLVDFDKKQIFAGRDMAMDMTKAFQPNADAGEVGENMLESMGGKKVGTEKFLGYNCDVWEFSGGKQWLYKGVMLKLEMTMLGITTITEAKTVEFEVSVPDKYFKLPDFPIQKEEGFMDNEEFEDDMEDMDANMEKLSKM
ncbi:MAG: hypothetical protein GQ525_07080 [Draconibacterium sp.]|nr:hypothetical protein [Draconibacterium sp.]